ncbi:hypothetical protein CO174_02515 [Candidatus Uhrbacteria bacterium CG_4_9_14_3_um_filter_50_9]|uniref:Uncharacterized protein n=1 Tax=Candidatus Uhrbacteria bacterium CG_4_9_14_3_um_filter_50_9 TaxID=1975035 RepID=A0A2M7XCE2_9BACT|nr:MAG: hypothetical protein CO174_02515 [Candidatus Uhrbacteria bacterium CG_4_9_14_3_um_filter_50_9]
MWKKTWVVLVKDGHEPKFVHGLLPGSHVIEYVEYSIIVTFEVTGKWEVDCEVDGGVCDYHNPGCYLDAAEVSVTFGGH